MQAQSAFSAPYTTNLRKLMAPMTEAQENRLRDLLNAAGVLAEALERAPQTDAVALDEALDSGTVLVDEHGADVVLQVHDVTVHVRK